MILRFYAAYNAGDLDFADTVPTDEIQSLLDNPEFHIIDNLGTYYVAFNVNSDLFAGKTPEQASAMRRGLSLLIDRDYIVREHWPDRSAACKYLCSGRYGRWQWR